MNLKGKQLRAALLGTFLILAFSVTFFLPEIISTCWHVRFGDSTTFHGWRVAVPRGWWAFTREDLLILQRPSRFYDREDTPGISVEVFRPGEPIDPEVMKQASIRALSRKGYVFQEEKPIQTGTDRGYCLHFAPGKYQKKIRISCYLSAAHLSLDLFGPSSETETLYSVVGQMRREVAPH